VTVRAGADEGWQEMPATVWADALDRYRATPLPERAAEVMATLAPALAGTRSAPTAWPRLSAAMWPRSSRVGYASGGSRPAQPQRRAGRTSDSANPALA